MYFLFALVVLVLAVTALVACGGARWISKLLRGIDKQKKRRSGGYRRVDLDKY